MDSSLESSLPQVYRFALSLTRDAHLAEDLLQETVVRACERREQLQAPGALTSWLFRITVNLWRDQLRRQVPVPRCVDDDPSCTARHSADLLSLQDDVRATLEVMQSLPDTQRAVLHLYAVEDLSLAEISEIMKLKPETARVHLCLARRTLRLQLPQIWIELQSSQRRS